MMRASPGDSENKKPQITQITQIFSLRVTLWLIFLLFSLPVRYSGELVRLPIT